MRFRVIVQSKPDFDKWVADQQKPAAQPTDPLAQKGLELFSQSTCVGCHTITGVSGGVLGPNLTHLQSRGTFAGAIFANNPENLTKWLTDPPKEKPGSVMPKLGLSDDEIRALVAYLETLH